MEGFDIRLRASFSLSGFHIDVFRVVRIVCYHILGFTFSSTCSSMESTKIYCDVGTSTTATFIVGAHD